MTKLYEANNYILIDTDTIQPTMHSHMAAHIIVSFGDKIKVNSEKMEYEGQGILIPSGVSHVVDTKGQRALVFLYDNTTAVATQIKETQLLSADVCKAIVKEYIESNISDSTRNYLHFEETVLHQLGIHETKCTIMDERIQSAIKYMHSMVSKKLTCKEVADFVHLSEGRFSHLFKEQVGMTFASYLIYKRIMYVYMQIIQGKSITDAAIEAGFSSSAHFADVNRRVFGLTASGLIQNLTFVKIE